MIGYRSQPQRGNEEEGGRNLRLSLQGSRLAKQSSGCRGNALFRVSSVRDRRTVLRDGVVWADLCSSEGAWRHGCCSSGRTDSGIAELGRFLLALMVLSRCGRDDGGVAPGVAYVALGPVDRILFDDSRSAGGRVWRTVEVLLAQSGDTGVVRG